MNTRRTIRGVVAFAAVVAIIGGVPLLLIRLAGSPIPAHVPDWHRLGTVLMGQDNSGSAFLTLVRELTWLAWLIFSLALVTELQAALRGRLAPRLHLGAIQSLAAQLAATAALTLTAPASVGLSSATPADATAMLTATPPHGPLGPSTAAAPLPGIELASNVERFRYVTVAPGDCLWSLAERYLGDGDLYPQIADLNLGHRMDDGTVFTNPTLIYPGWRLEIPADAAGSMPAQGSEQPPTRSGNTAHAGIASTGHAGHNTSYPRFSTPHPAASSSVSPLTSRPSAAAQSPTASTSRPSLTKAERQGREEFRQIADGAALALLAGGVLASLEALRRRQRSRRLLGMRIALPADDATRAAEQRLRAADSYYRDSPAPPPLSLRAALQELAAGLRASGCDLPECVGVHLEPVPPGLEILLARPAGEPPPPFVLAPARQEMTWQLDLTAVWPEIRQSRPPQVGELMPGLFTVGTTTTGYLLLDLELMRAAVVRGERAMTDRFITTAATELATNQWSGWYDLVLAGPFPELRHLDRVEQCDTIEEALQLLWLRKVSIDSRLGSADWPPGRTTVRSQRLVRPDDEDWALTVLVSRVPPTSEQFNDLVQLANSHGIAVLVPAPQGHAVDAPATIDLTPNIHAQGRATAAIRLGVLGADQEIVVETAMLTAADYGALGSLFATTRREDIRPDEQPYQDFVRPPWLPRAVAEAQVSVRSEAEDADGGFDDDGPGSPPCPPSASAEAAEPENVAAYQAEFTGPDMDFWERPPWLPPIATDIHTVHAAAIGMPGEAAFDPAPESAGQAEPEPTAKTQDGTTSEGLRICILGPAEVIGARHAISDEQTELLLALALTIPEKLSAPALAALLGTDPERPMPPAAVRQLVTRTRRALGLTADGGHYIRHDANGYYLSEEAWLDWTEFTELSQAGLEAEDTAKLGAALDLVRGHPLAGIRYWWIDAAMVETINAQVVDTALALAEARLRSGDAASAAEAARAGLRADPAAEQLSRVLMRAEHAAGNRVGMDAAWDDCHQAIHAVDPVGRPQEETTNLYRLLTAQENGPPVKVQQG